MKKVRLSLRRGVKSWSITLYDSVESAYYLKDEPFEENSSMIEDYRRVVTLSPGETLEVEWCGSEWVYDDDHLVEGAHSNKLSPFFLHKFDDVRIGKSTPMKGEDIPTSRLSVYSGWVVGSSIDWKKGLSAAVRITPIKGRMRSKFDFSKLFLDEDDEERPESAVVDSLRRSSSLTVLN